MITALLEAAGTSVGAYQAGVGFVAVLVDPRKRTATVNVKTTDNGAVRAILMSLPGVVQESLLAVLDSLPGVEIVGWAGGGLSALALLERSTPEVTIIDGNLSEDEVVAFIKDAKRLLPNLRLVVLTHTSRQRRRLLLAGADSAVSRWSRPHELARAVLGPGEVVS